MDKIVIDMADPIQMYTLRFALQLAIREIAGPGNLPYYDQMEAWMDNIHCYRDGEDEA
jgi:hypothetical protein